MKILMRADTHYSIGVRTSEYEEPRYTYSQVPSIWYTYLLFLTRNKFMESKLQEVQEVCVTFHHGHFCY